MSEQTITARFKGEDGSLGYRRGQVYTLAVSAPGRRYPVEITGGGQRCPYSSWATFEANWQILQAVAHD